MSSPRDGHPDDVIGWVDGVPVQRCALDLRLAALRAGPGAAALPAPGTREARQLRRWTAHVLFTEQVCRRAARELGLRDLPRHDLHPLAAVQLGSVTSAAWHSCRAVGAVCHALSPAADPAPPAYTSAGTRQWRRVSHAVSATPQGCAHVPLSTLGWTTLDDLPTALADALRVAPPGVLVGPVHSALGWHLALVEEVVERDCEAQRRPDGEQLREFARWLDRRRADLVQVAPGYEHPGDPHQPDNTHRH